MAKQYYASQEPSLKMYYKEEGEPNIRFTGGSLILDDEIQPDALYVEYLDELLDPGNPKGVTIRRLVRKIDRDGAMVAAKEFDKRRRNLGVSGALTSADLQLAMSAEVGPEQMVNELMQKHGCSRAEAEELYAQMESDLVRTVQGTNDAPDATAGNKPISMQQFTVGASSGSVQGKAGDTGDTGNAGTLADGADSSAKSSTGAGEPAGNFASVLAAAKTQK